MTLPIASRIADAVAAEINAAVAASSFETVGFTAERRMFDWDANFEGLDGLSVEVIFITKLGQGGDHVKLDSAASLSYPVKVDVVVLKRFDGDDHDQNSGRLKVESVDPLVRLLEQIQEHFVAARNDIVLSDVEDANWIGVEPYWINQSLMRGGLFQGAVRIAFEYTREI